MSWRTAYSSKPCHIILEMDDELENEIRAALAEALAATGALANSEQSYLRRLESDPRDASAWLALGKLRFGSGRLSEAESAVRNAIAISPGAEAWGLLGALLLTQRRWDQAALAYGEALAR